MNQHTKRMLKFAAVTGLAVLMLALTFNRAVDYWMPQAEVKKLSAPAPEPVALQIPDSTRPLPAAPLPPQPAAGPAEIQWNQPLFDPKFDGPGLPRSNGSAQGFSASDFRAVLNQVAPLQVVPPSVTVPGSDPAVVSIRPIFNSKAGGVESGVLGTAGNASGVVGGATSGASSLLKR